MSRILIVEDEKLLRWALAQQLGRAGHQVDEAGNLAGAAEVLAREQPDLVLLDIGLPDGHGLDFLETNQDRLEGSVVIVMTAVCEVCEAVRAMKLGAIDFLTKPVDEADLLRLVERSLDARGDRLEAQAARSHRERDLRREVIGVSQAFQAAMRVAEQVAASEVATILIAGESGSGKNVVARHIHALSRRRVKPMIEVSCATIPDNLLETELFGHERGAFTDAKTFKQGSFELAEGGTVILDEVGELKLDLQAKLLHFLEERRFRRVGGTREIVVDVRVIALTNRDLQAMVRDRTFRHDLYFRLSVFPIHLPPLRERPEDVLPLARHFLASLAPRLGRHFEGFDREAENRLLAYSWPGNARELRNVVERAMVIETAKSLSARSLVLDWAAEPALADEASAAGPGRDIAFTGIEQLERIEREMVARALRATRDNQTRAAELLGITRDQLRYRLKKFGLGSRDA